MGIRGASIGLLGSVAVAAVALTFASGSRAAAPESCDRFAAPSGSDSAAGTISSPYASAGRLVAALGSGQTGCFRGGTYGFEVLNIERPRITLAPYGTERVTLRGDIKVLPDGIGAAIEGMKLNGAGGQNEMGPRIYAHEVTLRGNEITNQHSGICVHLSRFYSEPAPRDVVIERNVIHDCGRLPATNHDHGIYIGQGRDTIVRDNWIYGNADRGVQQYPDTQGSLITGNVIEGNGQGVNFGGDDSNTNCSNNNVVQGNVITGSNLRWNVYSGSQGRPCSGNIVRNNCVHASKPGYTANGGVEPNSRSFSASSNTVGAPRFMGAGVDDYRLAENSPCLSEYTGTMSAPGSAPPPTLGVEADAIRFKANRRVVPRGNRFRVRGVVLPRQATARSLVIERRRRGGWHRLESAIVRSNGRFKDRVRVHGGRPVSLRAVVRGQASSRAVRVRFRR
jgi:Right handed beta helix region